MGEMSDFVQAHKPLVIGGVVLGTLLIGGYLLTKKSNTAAGASPNGLTDTSGLTNHLVYVPTQTSFITDNQNGVFSSNDPNLKSISVSGGLYSNSPQVTNSTSSSTTTTNPPQVVVPPVVVPPVIIPPRPKPKPKNNHDHDHDGPGHHRRVDPIPGPHPGPWQIDPTPTPVRASPPPQTTTATRGTLQWNQPHVMAGGETVSSLTSKVNRNLKATGMPGALAVSPHEVYAQNAGVIVPQARTSPGDHLTAAHAGTRIVLPRWSN